ncbi:Radical SAM superfamily protein [Planctomycetes bacterium CA13]|uniref:Radical SAM superfamily protein n=1 Tax=Novipirellula herctigrandis TaxID=2527986 RepID=A0A5C5YYG2_9BACT|nr:Radical SAM superfamily protein [Planctomycetes bacterium CA13]
MVERVVSPPNSPLLSDGSKLGGWYHVKNGRIVCDLCPRACSLKPGDRGFCFVRENIDGKMVLTTYGRSTGFCVDPIEKKPLNHFYPGTSALSFGTAGCNLGCKFCQNWTTTKSREVKTASQYATPEGIASTALELGCQTVAYTYNDPVIWAEYAIDTAKQCSKLGIKNVAVTAGYISAEARGEFYEHMDAANVDLKAFTEHFYSHLTLSHLQPVLDTLAWLKHETSVWLEITNLMIPEENDSKQEVKQMCNWIFDNLGDDVPLHFTAFHPDFRMRDTPPTPPETLIMAYEIAREAGLKFVYTGNVDDVTHQCTYCPSCSEILIERRGYDITRYHLRKNHCEFCGKRIAGCFGEQLGTWGSRRMPVEIEPQWPPK